MALIRVKDKSSSHEYSIHEHLFDAEAHEKSDKPAYGPDGLAAPPRYKTTVAKLASAKAGHSADPKKES